MLRHRLPQLTCLQRQLFWCAIQSMDARSLLCTEETSLYPIFETTARLYGYEPCVSTSSLGDVSSSNAQARRRRGTGTKVRGRCLQTNRTRSVNRILSCHVNKFDDLLSSDRSQEWLSRHDRSAKVYGRSVGARDARARHLGRGVCI